MKDAILNVHYQGITTHTGRALKCVGEEVLNRTGICQLPPDIEHIDIVTITDGVHNGPCKDSIESIVEALDGVALNVKRYVIAYENSETDDAGLSVLANEGDMNHVFYITSAGALAVNAGIIGTLPDCPHHLLPCE